MNPFRAIALLLMLSTTAVVASAQQSTPETTPARITGSVLDPFGAVIMEAKIVFKGEKGIHKVDPWYTGYYDIWLPAGIYRVSAEADGWFWPLKRPAFRLQPSATINLDLPLDTYGTVHGSKVINGRYEEAAWRVPVFNEETIFLKQYAPLDLLIRFGAKKVTGGTIQYEMAKSLDGTPVPVRLMFDLVTVRAKKVTLDRKNARVTAEGDVIVHRGKQKEAGGRVVTTFKNGNATISVNE